MLCDVFTHLRQGETVKTYMARVVDKDNRYVFKRIFMKSVWKEGENTYDLIHDGVYESCARYFDASSGRLVRREREWFVYYEKEYYSIEAGEVLKYCHHPELAAALLEDVS